MLIQFAPMVLIFVVFWFLLIRPQQKKAKEHRAMVAALKRGDRVVTNGGIYGQVSHVADDHLMVEIADGVKIKIVRDAVAADSRQARAGEEGRGQAGRQRPLRRSLSSASAEPSHAAFLQMEDRRSSSSC